MIGEWVEQGKYPADMELLGSIVRDIATTTRSATLALIWTPSRHKPASNHIELGNAVATRGAPVLLAR
ncbi:MAG: hypothetical protein ACLU1W_00820 [Collinsella sp.]